MKLTSDEYQLLYHQLDSVGYNCFTEPNHKKYVQWCLSQRWGKKKFIKMLHSIPHNLYPTLLCVPNPKPSSTKVLNYNPLDKVIDCLLKNEKIEVKKRKWYLSFYDRIKADLPSNPVYRSKIKIPWYHFNWEFRANNPPYNFFFDVSNVGTHFGIELRIEPDGDHDINFHIGFGIFSIFMGLNGVFPPWQFPIGWHQNNNLSIHHGTIWATLWDNDHNWTRKSRQWNWNFVEFLTGKAKYSEKPHREERCEVEMPEGKYWLKCEFYEAQWHYPRWFTLTVKRVTVKPEIPIAYPGKGENSWDCDEDALMESTFPGDTIEEACEHVYESVMDRRKRYGSGISYRPQKDWSEKPELVDCEDNSKDMEIL